MLHPMTRARTVLGAALIGGLLAAPACSLEHEDVAVKRQALGCQSVDDCNDGDPCTDDVCALNVCRNLPLLNCLGAMGGASATAGASSAGTAGQASHSGGALAVSGGSSSGGSNSAGSRGGGQASGGVETSFGGSSAHGGVTANGGSSGENSSAAGGNDAHIDGGSGASSDDGGDGGGGTGTVSNNDVWLFRGGACDFTRQGRRARSPESVTLAVLGLLVFARRKTQRRPTGAIRREDT